MDADRVGAIAVMANDYSEKKEERGGINIPNSHARMVFSNF